MALWQPICAGELDFWIPLTLWWQQIEISQFPHKCEKENARRWIKTIKTWVFGWFEINLFFTITRLKWSSVLYILLKASFDKREKEIIIIQAGSIIFMRYGNLLADHDFLWISQSTQPSNEKLKLNHSTIGCLYFARAPTNTSCQPFASKRLQILQQGACSLVAW